MTLKMLFERLNDLEAPWCHSASLRGEQLDTQRFFAVVSRLGDGIFWYLVMLLLPVLYGRAGVAVALHMLGVGIVSLLVYTILKRLTGRQRPCERFSNVHRHAPMLDLYSFPSGHTMHAVGFTAVLLGHFPELGIVIAPFVFLVASSRLVLGLHYPSDVIAGALIGGLVSWSSFSVFT
ncbi:MAG: phosphatase PAP2 family protein [Chromatiaceae bacterium]|nr:phosphatase PAP2 family protein [Gammaproteobacteria bacterium]MCP5299971.1 phosphatase PAP2 family protein [Chromatiaceae bacterium]MCP5422043.1 phosphatase PAP2 family protein [Chromatiaceae bacterium]